MFATVWVWFVPDRDTSRDAVLRQNPESIVLPLALFASLAAIIMAVLAHLASRLFMTNLPETKG